MGTNFFPCSDLSGFGSEFLKPTFVLERRTAFRNDCMLGVGTPRWYLGRDIFLLLSTDSFLHFAHNRERIHPLGCGRPLCSCVSLCLPIIYSWPGKLVWDDKLSRWEGDQEVKSLWSEGRKMMQLVSSVTTGYDSSWAEVRDAFLI